MSEISKKIGNRIRLLRTAKNYSQENMAESLGMCSSGYAKIEQGRTDISISRIESIAKILDMDINQFFAAITDSGAFFLHLSGNNASAQTNNKSATVNNYHDSDRVSKLQNDVENLQKLMEKILGELKNGKN